MYLVVDERLDFRRRHQWIASHVPDWVANNRGDPVGYEVFEFQEIRQ